MAKILISYYINIIHAGFVDIVVNRDISQRVHCFFLLHKSSSVSSPRVAQIRVLTEVRGPFICTSGRL